MNTLHKHPGHTCVDGNMPCPACVAASIPVPHPEHGYYRPVINCMYCGQVLRWFEGRLVGDDGSTLCYSAITSTWNKAMHAHVVARG